MKLDKVYHLIAGFLIATLVGYAAGPMWGLAAGAAAGTGKELWDLAGNGTPSWGDFVATVFGGAAAVATLSLLT